MRWPALRPLPGSAQRPDASQRPRSAGDAIAATTILVPVADRGARASVAPATVFVRPVTTTAGWSLSGRAPFALAPPGPAAVCASGLEVSATIICVLAGGSSISFATTIFLTGASNVALDAQKSVALASSR